jgi:hypothetical protein
MTRRAVSNTRVVEADFTRCSVLTRHQLVVVKSYEVRGGRYTGVAGKPL